MENIQKEEIQKQDHVLVLISIKNQSLKKRSFNIHNNKNEEMTKIENKQSIELKRSSNIYNNKEEMTKIESNKQISMIEGNGDELRRNSSGHILRDSNTKNNTKNEQVKIKIITEEGEEIFDTIYEDCDSRDGLDHTFHDIAESENNRSTGDVDVSRGAGIYSNDRKLLNLNELSDASIGQGDVSRGDIDMSRGEMDTSPGEMDMSRGEVDLSRGEVDQAPECIDRLQSKRLEIKKLNFTKPIHFIDKIATTTTTTTTSTIKNENMRLEEFLPTKKDSPRTPRMKDSPEKNYSMNSAIVLNTITLEKIKTMTEVMQPSALILSSPTVSKIIKPKKTKITKNNFMSAWIHSNVSSRSNTASIKRFKKKFKDQESDFSADTSAESNVSFFVRDSVHISDQFQLPKKPSKGFLKLILELIPQLDALIEETSPTLT